MDAGAVPATSTNLIQMAKTITECYECKTSFKKRNSDYNRIERENKKHFCSLSCAAIYRNKYFPNSGNPKNLKVGSDLDKYSPFRYFLNAARRRKAEHPDKSRYQEINITLEYLFDLWKAQRGICPYSKHKMLLTPKMSEKRSSPFCASLDRINPLKGYVKGNVQFVTQFVNLGKNRFSDKEIKSFFEKK